MAVKGRLDFCCLQKTRRRGGGARKMGTYKLFWACCEKGIHSVGMLVADRWIEKVLDVKRVSERLMVVRVIVGRSVLNLVSVYSPQSGWSKEVKEEFLVMLGEVVLGIDSGERLLICGDSLMFPTLACLRVICLLNKRGRSFIQVSRSPRTTLMTWLAIVPL